MARRGPGGGGGAQTQPRLPQRPGEIMRILNFASHQLGVPYTWGGTTRSGGFDCSGLVYAAYRNAGYTGIGRTTYDQIKQGIAVGMNQLKPGDIVFPEAGHEGLYIGRGMILEAPHTGDVVKTIPLSSFGFWQARRLIGGGGGIIPPRALGGVTQNGLPVPHPSVNPQLYQQFLQTQKQQMAQFSQTMMSQMAKSNAAFQQQLKTQAAQQRQSQLALQLQQQQQDRVNAASTAQRSLIGGAGAGVSADPTTNLVEQNRQKAQDLRTQALRRAGLA